MTRCDWCKEPENVEKLKELCAKGDRTWREMKQVAEFCKQHGGIPPLSGEAIIPLIRERDDEVRQKAIQKISEGAIGKQHAGRGHKKKITAKKVVEVLSEIRKEIRDKTPLPPLPNSTYRTVVIDPPWEIKKIGRVVAPNQIEMDYPMMSVKEIIDFPIIPNSFEKSGCHIYLWTTHKHLPDALDIFKSWGVKYQCVLTWIKNVGFTPFSWMYSTELVLFGRVGSLPLLKNGLRIDFNGKVREHSRKPDEFYDLVRQASPEPRIDIFSREKRDGFEQYGNEVNRFKK